MTYEAATKINEDAKEYRRTLEEMITTAETVNEVETIRKCFMCYADGIITALKATKSSEEDEKWIKMLNGILADYQNLIKLIAERKIGSLYNSGKTE